MKKDKFGNSYKAIKATLRQLKDFQNSTVDYVYTQLYRKNRKKVLIADEVGLGKTIVAKGVIAKAFRKYLNDGGPSKENPTFNVVYICSNLAIARQNINKLNIFNYWGNEDSDPDKYVETTINRLIYLSYAPPDKPPVFLINSLTPGTSLDEKSSLGEATERVIIYRLLTKYKVFQNNHSGLEWLLKGGVSHKYKMRERIKEDKKNELRQDLFKKFRDELQDTDVTPKIFPKVYGEFIKSGNISLWDLTVKASKKINNSNKHRFKSKHEIIRGLRRVLSRICLEYFGADIFILDEFQRFNNLIRFDIDEATPAQELARAVFDIKEAKILMLSATPFKPYTNDFDELNGEVHHKEFEVVLKFLMENDSEKLWKQFQFDRKSFFKILREIQKINEQSRHLIDIRTRLENIYRRSMVRTERLIVSKNHDAMIKSVLKDSPLKITKQDIEEFISADKIVKYLNDHYDTKLNIPLEYSKSSPFLFSYMDNYQHKRKLENHAKEDIYLKKMLIKYNNLWLNFKSIDKFKPIISNSKSELSNPKLRILLEENLYNRGWQYLWVPPTIEYYTPELAYKDSHGYTKCLVFSSWLLVPRMIASVASYEAERLTVGDPKTITGQEERIYSAKKRTPIPQFTYKVDVNDQDPKNMMNFSILYPSLTLSDIFDPATQAGEPVSINETKSKIRNLLKDKLQFIVNKYGKGNGDSKKWFWIAPLLLDREFAKKGLIKEWFNDGIPSSDIFLDAEEESTQSDENSGKEIHFNYARNSFINPKNLDLPPLDEDRQNQLLDFLVNLSLGSPSICSLRSIHRYFKLSSNNLNVFKTIHSAAFNIASAFLTLFNKPESIAIIRKTTSSKIYLNKVLEYSIDGNIQSMLDEYIYLLIDCENLKTIDELTMQITDTLSIRTSRLKVDTLDNFINVINGKGSKRKLIRTHFASDFLNQKLKTASQNDRTINIRQAFNSPFRPFILASTSIGQEGLDFHLYCKRIFHWNLPSNAIDLEQREGRIHRYKGLVIRQNVVDMYISKIKNSTTKNLWDELFTIAMQDKQISDNKCELIPFWHVDTDSDIKIERYIPLYPFSQDIDKYSQIQKVLAYYRLTFGQPRQEELINAIYHGNENQNLHDKLEEFLINLSPIVFMKKN
ncbi:MAG: helicase-related protein [Candidatus Thorarchaeota archaeon]